MESIESKVDEARREQATAHKRAAAAERGEIDHDWRKGRVFWRSEDKLTVLWQDEDGAEHGYYRLSMPYTDEDVGVELEELRAMVAALDEGREG